MKVNSEWRKIDSAPWGRASTTSKHYARFSPNYLRKVADAVRRRI